MKDWTTSPGSKVADLIYKEESYEIVGACIEVHRTLGPGFPEPVYQEALELELMHRQIEHQTQRRFSIRYRGVKLDSYFVPDFVCLERIIVEIKALKRLSNLEISQTLNYLKVSKLKLALLVNFGSYGKLEWKRVVL